ncbi:hypothetical protein [Bacteroides caecimuris]|uniref:hypothetical protein n=1 Tax=Bacteroides caecimuris TaxID=1796613 RepID=UPI00265A4D10|nr:hypothetical protein [Bacteroides caecimuris]
MRLISRAMCRQTFEAAPWTEVHRPSGSRQRHFASRPVYRNRQFSIQSDERWRMPTIRQRIAADTPLSAHISASGRGVTYSSSSD